MDNLTDQRPGSKLCRTAYPGEISTIHASPQSWHAYFVIQCWDIGRIRNETASWGVAHALEEAAVVDLQYGSNDSKRCRSVSICNAAVYIRMLHGLLGIHNACARITIQEAAAIVFCTTLPSIPCNVWRLDFEQLLNWPSPPPSCSAQNRE